MQRSTNLGVVRHLTRHVPRHRLHGHVRAACGCNSPPTKPSQLLLHKTRKQAQQRTAPDDRSSPVKRDSDWRGEIDGIGDGDGDGDGDGEDDDDNDNDNDDLIGDSAEDPATCVLFTRRFSAPIEPSETLESSSSSSCEDTSCERSRGSSPSDSPGPAQRAVRWPEAPAMTTPPKTPAHGVTRGIEP
jgi:hypothetical protein